MRLKKNELKPWLNKEWCISPKANAEFACNMEAVLEVYKRAHDSMHPLVCMDESSKQQTKEVQAPIAMKPGKQKQFDTQYERNGVSNLFMFFAPLEGWRRVDVTDHRTAKDWAHQIRKLVDNDFPDAEKITLVMDNLNTHNLSSLYKAFAPEEARRIIEKIEIHHTPKHGSWLNMAEIEFSVLSRQCLNRRIPNQDNLIKEVSQWTNVRNKNKTKVNWRFTTQDARIKLKRLYPSV